MILEISYGIAIVVAVATLCAVLIRSMTVNPKFSVFGFFQEDNGNPSSTRLNTTIMCCVGCYVAITQAANIQMNTILLVGALCGIGAVWKVGQKNKEEGSPDTISQEATK